MSLRRFVLVVLFLAMAFGVGAGGARAVEPAPLKVLYITGGGYHDYQKLTPLLTESMTRHANVVFDVKWGVEPLRDPHLGDGFDAIVYNLCFADEKDESAINNAVRVTQSGKPTVLVHCSMHCFQASDAWTECCGQRTRRHDAYRPFGTVKADPEHPVMKNFPDQWTTAGDELYQTIEFGKNSTALLKVKSAESGNVHTVCWVHKFGNGNVFATTLGHDMKTAEQADYHRLLAHGLLWACGKLTADGKPADGYAPIAK